MLLPIALVSRRSVVLDRRMLRVVIAAAALETVGFVAFTSALDLGPVAVVAVVAAQFCDDRGRPGGGRVARAA